MTIERNPGIACLYFPDLNETREARILLHSHNQFTKKLIDKTILDWMEKWWLIDHLLPQIITWNSWNPVTHGCYSLRIIVASALSTAQYRNPPPHPAVLPLILPCSYRTVPYSISSLLSYSYRTVLSLILPQLTCNRALMAVSSSINREVGGASCTRMNGCCKEIPY